MRHFEMHEKHCMCEEQEKILYLMQFGNVGHLVGIGVNVGLFFVPAVCGSISDDGMCSCFYSRIHRGRLGLARRYRGDLASATIPMRSRKALKYRRR